MDVPVVQVSTTAPSEEVAGALATVLVNERLAACVQVLGPIRSVYRWEGDIEDAAEWLCVAKTTAALAARVTETIVAAHPYEVPEVLVTPVVGGNPDYLRWVGDEATA